jgi:hypothetical protein
MNPDKQGANRAGDEEPVSGLEKNPFQEQYF